MTFSVTPIGVIHSCFKEKFGIPRQPGLVPAARARVELFSPFNRAEAFVGLESFSHLWLTFVFHQSLDETPRLSARPPRLGGNRKLGVFATRSPHRPNGIGLSVVEVEKIWIEQGKVSLILKGADLVDGTPILDIKPYLPYSDALPEAQGGFAPEAPPPGLAVVFESGASAKLARYQRRWPELGELIEQVLRLDPRPAYFKGSGRGKTFGMRLYDLDIRWEVRDATVFVVDLVEVEEKGGKSPYS